MLTELSATLAAVGKLVFYAAVLVVVGYVLWQNASRVASAWRDFLDQLRQFFSRLWGHRPESPDPSDHLLAQDMPPRRPFSDFADPFASGLAARCSANELIRYTFEALEAWARENGCPRAPDQTPHEFAQRVATCQRSLGTDAHHLASLYARAAYAEAGPPASATEPLKRLWRQLGRETVGG
jgi:hypothetical protein